MLSVESVSQQYYTFIKEHFSNDPYAFAKNTGRFYTHDFISAELVSRMLNHMDRTHRVLRVIDPFCGDGRLVAHFISEYLGTSEGAATEKLLVSLWDIDADAVKTAEDNLSHISKQYPSVSFAIDARVGDSFMCIASEQENYDVCITNPPWCILKPKTREKKDMPFSSVHIYEDATDAYSNTLRNIYEYSVGGTRFGRFDINLSRCGAEISLKLLSSDGICGIVMPATVISDQVSEPLRRWMIDDFNMKAIAYYPAELKLFGTVDQTSATIVIRRDGSATEEFCSTVFDRSFKRTDTVLNGECLSFIRANNYAIPFDYDEELFAICKKLQKHNALSSYPGIWIGREIDETRICEKLSDTGSLRFLKGYMVNRYSLAESPVQYLREDIQSIPVSVQYERLAWRDVSRATQKRRMHATIVPPMTIAGNSLSIICVPNATHNQLCYLLAVLNSFVFEFQARRNIITNHVPSGVIKKVSIPMASETYIDRISELVDVTLNNANDLDTANAIECLVGKMYGLSLEEFLRIIETFHLTKEESDGLMGVASRVWEAKTCFTSIPNHYAPKLSDLDMQIISHVPQGSNWKNIPESVPSQRLSQIRESYKAGKGSRSTYYGRLREEMPAYTISTYFSRPGNGCNIHYEQKRTLSQREAARIQSFPDNFEFKGSLSAINDQIGNAVPPLLAYQIASALPFKGQFVDLFCGAGGLSLGFTWAGWIPVVGSDINSYAVETHKHNISEDTICGDICSSEIVDEIVKRCQVAIRERPELPLFIIGGPPCQGFSTANRYGNMNDQRNWLFKAYSRSDE